MEQRNIKQIGERLRGLREVLDIPMTRMAQVCDTSVEHYMKMEAGESDPSVYYLNKISKAYGIALDVLLFGSEPRMQAYFVTRRGQSQFVEHRDDYSYQSLASGFKNRTMDVFYTIVDPLPEGKSHRKNSAPGQEVIFVQEGRLEFIIDDKVIELGAGDTVYFDTSHPHCMNALGDEPVKFLCVIV